MQVTSHPWEYKGYALTAGPSCFGEMAPFIALWQSRMSDEGKLPSWRDFDFFDFRGFWGRVSLAEVRQDPFDLYFRLWGTDLADWWGIDYSGSLLSEDATVTKDWAAAEIVYFERLTVGDSFGLFTGTLEDVGRGHVRVQGVDLPLAREGQVSHILSTYLREDTHGTLRPDIPVTFRC